MHASVTTRVGEGQNNFDNVRVGLALIVFFSHALGLPNEAKLASYAHYFNADFAVKAFFVISGYLIFRSYVRSDSIADFLEKRIRRIYPAYLLAVLLCVLIGLAVTNFSLHEFLTSHQTIKYLVSNLAFLNFIQPTLPGVFMANSNQAVDGSLWTIKVELMLYGTVPLIACAFKRFGLFQAYALMLTIGLLWTYYFGAMADISIGAEIARQFPGQLPYFAFGALLAAAPSLERWLPLMIVLGLSTLALTSEYSYRLLIEPIAYGALTIFLCLIKNKGMSLGKIGDLSYGIYLFHFPIVQMFINANVYESNPMLGVVLSLVLTLVLSFTSWHLVEKKFLRRNSHYREASAA